VLLASASAPGVLSHQRQKPDAKRVRDPVEVADADIPPPAIDVAETART